VRPRKYLDSVRHAGKWYWVRLVAFIIGGLVLGSWVGTWEGWIDSRYQIYHRIQHWFPRAAYERDTAFVLVGDEEYWRQGLRRVPIRRDYVAKLIRALDSVNPAVIVLDFDLRSPMPIPSAGAPLEPRKYACETRELVKAIRSASVNRVVVLPKTVNRVQGKWVYESDVIDDLDLGKGKIIRGFVALPFDKRRIPLSLPLPGGALDSLSLAAAKAKDPDVSAHLERQRQTADAPFAGYLDKEEFERNVVPSGEFLKNPQHFRNKLMCKIVLVGGAWSTSAYGRGPVVDLHNTPAGMLPGAFLHANYIEAFLDGRLYSPTSEGAALLIEILLVAAVAFVFFEHRAPRKILMITLLLITGVAVSYVYFINFGIFFDFLIPLIAVVAHALVEQILEWWHDARLYRQFVEAKNRTIEPNEGLLLPTEG
jgi:CHASE2 domain-containing sensor protein